MAHFWGRGDTTHPPVGFIWCDTRGKSRKKYFLYLFGVSINMQKNSYFLIFFENFRVILHANAFYFFNFRALAKKKVASDLLRFGSQLLPSRFFVSWPETCGPQSNRWPGKKHKNALFSRTARATFTSKHLAKHTRCDSCKSGLHFV